MAARTPSIAEKVYAGSNQLFADAATGQHHTIRPKHGTLPDVALVNAT